MNIFYNEVQIRQFTRGRVVKPILPITFSGSTTDRPDQPIGHVMGFSTNTARQVMIIVQWCHGETAPIHPDNLILL